MVEGPLVSIITPTYGRQAFLPAIAACVQSQSYQKIEWLILDDSERPSVDFVNQAPNKVKYLHSPKRLSVGEKRNRLIDAASGDVVVHFDDDDFYGENYIANSVDFLLHHDLDVALLSGFFVAHLDVNCFGYYRTLIKQGPGYAFNKHGVRSVNLGKLNIPLIHLCYGWSYIYRKTVWDRIKYKEISVFEDREFISAAQKEFRSQAHESKLIDCLHVIHHRSSSQCFPQFLIPDFVVRALSTAAYQHVTRLKRELAQAAMTA